MARGWIAAGMVAALLAAALVFAAPRQGRACYDEYDERRAVRFGTVIQRDLDSDESRLMRDGGLDSVRFWLSGRARSPSASSTTGTSPTRRSARSPPPA